MTRRQSRLLRALGNVDVVASTLPTVWLGDVTVGPIHNTSRLGASVREVRQTGTRWGVLRLVPLLHGDAGVPSPRPSTSDDRVMVEVSMPDGGTPVKVGHSTRTSSPSTVGGSRVQVVRHGCTRGKLCVSNRDLFFGRTEGSTPHRAPAISYLVDMLNPHIAAAP